MPCRKPRATRGGRGRGRAKRKAAEPEWTSSDSDAAPTPEKAAAPLDGSEPVAAAAPKELRPRKEGVTNVTDAGTASGDEPMPDAESSDEWEDIDAGL